MQLAGNLSRLYFTALKTLWWYVSRWPTVKVFTRRYFMAATFIVQEMLSVNGLMKWDGNV